MAWFTRSKENIERRPAQTDDRAIPDGIWSKCPDCKEILYQKVIEENLFTCPNCNKHFRIGSKEYFQILLDNGVEEEIAAGLVPADPLGFQDAKPYPVRIADATRKTKLEEAMRVGCGVLD